jgi:hypothetical protein
LSSNSTPPHLWPSHLWKGSPATSSTATSQDRSLHLQGALLEGVGGRPTATPYNLARDWWDSGKRDRPEEPENDPRFLWSPIRDTQEQWIISTS